MNKKVIVGILAIVLLVVGYRNILWGDDKIAYNIAVECANESFKNPSTMKLLEASLLPDKDIMVCRVSADNSYGGAVTKYYWFWDDGSIHEGISSDMGIGCRDVNVSKINRALKKYFN